MGARIFLSFVAILALLNSKFPPTARLTPPCRLCDCWRLQTDHLHLFDDHPGREDSCLHGQS